MARHTTHDGSQTEIDTNMESTYQNETIGMPLPYPIFTRSFYNRFNSITSLRRVRNCLIYLDTQVQYLVTYL